MSYIFFVHYFLEEHQGYLQYLAVMNKTAMNKGEKVPIWYSEIPLDMPVLVRISIVIKKYRDHGNSYK